MRTQFVLEYMSDTGGYLYFVPYRKRFALTSFATDAQRFDSKEAAEKCLERLQCVHEDLVKLIIVEWRFDEIH